MGNVLSKRWSVWISEYILTTIVYFVAFRKCFVSVSKNKQSSNESIQNALDFATNFISTINAIICVVLGNSTWFYKMWRDHAVKDIGFRAPFHAQAFLLSYLTADLVSLSIGYLKYKKHVKIRWDTLLHHICGILPFILLEIPEPKYYWVFLSQYPGFFEITTIFLNLTWFSKYLNWSKKVRRVLKFCFVVGWFSVRVPLIVILLLYTINIWKDIESQYPKRIKYTIIVLWIVMGGLQAGWTVALIYKVVQYFINLVYYKYYSAPGPGVHGQQIQLSSMRVHTNTN
eukprot:412180_1